MSDSQKPSTASAGRLSERLADRYHLQLTGELADWFDDQLWKGHGGCEFSEPVRADVLLAQTPEPIWPGLMPCDMLPVIGNRAGDWLCLRVDANNRVGQVVQWYHGGGDWLPWGGTLSAAIWFDAIRTRLPHPSRRHVDSRSLATSGSGDFAGDPWLNWAQQHLPAEVADLINPDVDGDHVVEVMLRCEVAEIAMRCELVQAALKETLSATLDPTTAEQLGVDWNQVVQWMFDTGRMPTETRQRLERDYGLTISKPQDWQSAESHARHVIELAPELAWAWDVIGYAAERRGDDPVAIDAYRRGASCSVFTDQSVRLRTHWTNEDAAKFSASRLHRQYPEIIGQSDYLQILCGGPSRDRRRRLSSHWVELAQQAAEDQQWDLAHQRYVAAGWDLGADPMSCYGELLERIAEAAEQCGQHARAELARTHRRCLKVRYRI